MPDKIEAKFKQIKETIEESLVGEIICTLAQCRPNQVIDADQEGLTVSARTETKAAWDWIKGVHKILVRREEIERKDLQEGGSRVRGGFRSSFIFALLVQFAHIEVRTSPRIALIYHQPKDSLRLVGGGE